MKPQPIPRKPQPIPLTKEYIAYHLVSSNGHLRRSVARLLPPDILTTHASYKAKSVKELLYLIINNLQQPPSCKNPVCSNTPSFLGFSRGYSVCCSSQCVRKSSRKSKTKNNHHQKSHRH